MSRAVKVRELGKDESEKLKVEGAEKLRGKVVIIKPEDSEIAKHLEIKEKGIYGIKFR